MKKSNIILFVLLVTINSWLRAQEVSTSLVFEERVFDFGKIQEKDGKVSHTFVFKNEGKTPIIISDITSGCGCTSHDYTKAPIKPGEKGKVIISYNPAYRPGFFSKEIVVHSNSRKNFNRIWIKGTVVPTDHPVEDDYPYTWGYGLYTNLKVLSFGTIAIGKSKSIEFRYANDTNKPMKLSFIAEGNNSNISFTNPKALAPKEKGKMVFNYTMKQNNDKNIITNIYIVVDGKKLPDTIQVKATTSSQ